MAAATIGDLLRTWRTRRSCSQMALALDAGVSTRHLSFVETGRSKPSPELVLALAERLDVPLRERNTMLLAAGYAPRFTSHPLDDEAMAVIRSSLERVLDAHDPFPGLVLDKYWNIVMANRAASRLLELLPAELRHEPVNLFRASLHPDGLARYTTNFDHWGTYLLRQLDRLAVRFGDDDLRALRSTIESYPNVGALARKPPRASDTDLVISCALDLLGQRLELFTTLTTFGSPLDVTLDELLIELFFPADPATERALADFHAPG